MSKLRRPTHSTVIAYLALFTALGGSAYAVATIGGNDIREDAIRNRHIHDNAVRSAQIAPSAISSSQVAFNSLTGRDIDESTLNLPPGVQGAEGPTGAEGPRGEQGAKGEQGDPCLPSNPACVGPPGPPGPQGLAAVSEFAEFFALMPFDNPGPVAPGTPVEFPQDGPEDGDIARLSPAHFQLPEDGIYRVAFLVSVDEPGQLVLTLDGVELAYTVYGRSTGTSQIAGEALVETPAPNSIITVANPISSAISLTITPNAGDFGFSPAAASIVIERLR